MSTDDVAAQVAALRGRLGEDPARGRLTLSTAVTLGEGLRCEAPFRRQVVVADEPASAGGTDTAPNPLELAIGALATCQAITYRVWAGILGVRLDRVEVAVEADIDLAGFFGTGDAPAGFTAVRLRSRLTGPEPPERYQDLEDAVDRHCPVLDLVGRPVPVERGPLDG